MSLFPEAPICFYSLLFISPGSHSGLSKVTKCGFGDWSLPEEENHGHRCVNFENGEKLDRDVSPCVSSFSDGTTWCHHAQCCLLHHTIVRLISPWGFGLSVTLDSSQFHRISLIWTLGFFCRETQMVKKLIILLMCIRTSEHASHLFIHSFVLMCPSVFRRHMKLCLCVYTLAYESMCLFKNCWRSHSHPAVLNRPMP